jgi:hypothetical protein
MKGIVADLIVGTHGENGLTGRLKDRPMDFGVRRRVPRIPDKVLRRGVPARPRSPPREPCPGVPRVLSYCHKRGVSYDEGMSLTLWRLLGPALGDLIDVL